MWQWEVIVEAWPFSTGVGQLKDQEACGPREAPCYVTADDIAEAMRFAKVIAETLKRNPRVWKAPIVSVRRVRETAEGPFKSGVTIH